MIKAILDEYDKIVADHPNHGGVSEKFILGKSSFEDGELTIHAAPADKDGMSSEIFSCYDHLKKAKIFEGFGNGFEVGIAENEHLIEGVKEADIDIIFALIQTRLRKCLPKSVVLEVDEGYYSHFEP
jgi:hypothetical protein